MSSNRQRLIWIHSGSSYCGTVLTPIQHQSSWTEFAGVPFVDSKQETNRSLYQQEPFLLMVRVVPWTSLSRRVARHFCVRTTDKGILKCTIQVLMSKTNITPPPWLSFKNTDKNRVKNLPEWWVMNILPPVIMRKEKDCSFRNLLLVEFIKFQNGLKVHKNLLLFCRAA